MDCNWSNREGNSSWHTYFFWKEYTCCWTVLQELIRKYGKYPVSTDDDDDDDNNNNGTWYPSKHINFWN